MAELAALVADVLAAEAEVLALLADVADNCALYLDEYSPPATGPDVLVAQSCANAAEALAFVSDVAALVAEVAA